MKKSIKVNSHLRGGSKVNAHNRTIESKKASSGNSNMSPLINFKIGERVLVAGLSPEIVFKIIDKEKRDGIQNYEVNYIDSKGELKKNFVVEGRLIKLQKDNEGFHVVDNNLIYYYDKEYNYQTSKMR